MKERKFSPEQHGGTVSDKMLAGQMLEKRREAAAESTREGVEEIGDDLKAALYDYMRRPQSDPAVLELVKALIGKLDHTAMFGESDKPLSAGHTEALKASLIGARMVLTPERGRSTPEEEPPYHSHLAHKFLDLVHDRVGNVDEKTGKAKLLMRVSPDQESWNLEHEYKKR